MYRIVIIANPNKEVEKLCQGLTREGFECSITSPDKETVKKISRSIADLVLLATDGDLPYTEIQSLCQMVKQKELPLIVLADDERLGNVEPELNKVDDFILKPYRLKEVTLRIKRLLGGTAMPSEDEMIKCGDLLIDLPKCSVYISGKTIMLTFMEYELLKFLASSPGRVFTRQTLLNKVWGYDYYGGERTVDVHITRLRSKIQESKQTRIDTVRNIGYRLTVE